MMSAHQRAMSSAFEILLQADRNWPPITVVNAVDNVGPPRNFYYTNVSCYGPGVPPPAPELIPGCLCTPVCIPGKCFCTDTEKLAYTEDGRLIAPDQGTAIFECSVTCACADTCINRVVQRGRKIELQVFRTRGKGWGVRTMERIPALTFVDEYVGEIITDEEAEQRGMLYRATHQTYLFDLDGHMDLDDGQDIEYCIDAADHGNVAHFVNHSCVPNMLVKTVHYDHHSIALHHLAFFTTCDIEAGEELTFDYSDQAGGDGVACACGAAECRLRVHL